MLFCSQGFVLFFAVVFAVHWALPWPRARVALLLAASVFFYASWSAWLALVVLGSSTVDWLLARRLDASDSPRERKLLVAASVVGNLGLLAWFKYAGFFLRTLEATLRAAGAGTTLPVLEVVLPIGISFYTFEAINYSVSVYRREIPAERSLPRFLLFILFFPHLVAGPIVRARDFLPQIARRKRWSWPRLQVALGLVVLGLVKKLVLADQLARVADPVFADPTSHTRLAAWCAALAYEGQCYCDFSGYSDLALGLAHALGYRLAVNFDAPFLATSPPEFWRRWHVSLMTWFRDYVYFPLGGSRHGTARTLANVVVVMTLAGLWHGANVTFVAWGFASGVLLVLHRLFALGVQRVPRVDRALLSPPGTLARIGATFVLVSTASVLFRADSLPVAGRFLERLVLPGGGTAAPNALVGLECGLAVALGHALHALGAPRWIARWPAAAQGLAYATAVTLALVLAPAAGKTFVYFQF